ncbi:MAG TPA: hypothetical protein VK823_11395 [Streptosporangiaceae bacterium]|jgi:hypothetical protein|nr:hypothetical protein [Streptosporangiaceae bacterium]
MPASLQETLLAPESRTLVADDCFALIERGIAGQSGISGTAVKLAYKTVNTFKPGHVRFMVDSLLPDMVDKLEPYWAGYRSDGGAEFGDYLAKNGAEVSQALLGVTDARAAASGRPVIVKAYGTVRGGAAKHIQAALPEVGEIVQKYAS